MVLRCGHSFCELCAEESINFSDKCPLCRQKSVGICIFNRSLDQCIQSWIATQHKSIKEAYRQRVAQYSKILLLKNKARIILWTVISRSRNNGVKINDVERLYNEIQREWGRETVEFDADLREQMRREALLHDGCFFKLFQDDNSTKQSNKRAMLIPPTITVAPDYASTSDFDGASTEKDSAYMAGWNLETSDDDNTLTTTSYSYLICKGCHHGSNDLAQSFVLYFAPTVVILALIMCIARLLFTYCAFRRNALTNTPPPPTPAPTPTRRRHHGRTLAHDDRNTQMSYQMRGSFAHIFMQAPPPSYEQAQKYAVAPLESSNDPAPPAYAYYNPSYVTSEQQSAESTPVQHTIVAPPSSQTDACNSRSSESTASDDSAHTNGRAPSSIT
ncbi:unnamed protein product [Toxocara canis]|uniref:Putative RING finger protein T02C1.1 n=1 Tax=Toxocara canis TaxID=6265 RepID=A0A183UL62_TOXCA|nr:unnamed protein product [Toxocara canis]